MIERIFSIGIVFCILVSVLGCKDVVQQPLSGHYKLDNPHRVESIVGLWSATGELGSLELGIALDDRVHVGGYRFKMIEGGELFYGKAVGAFYEDKMIISLDLQALRIQEGKGLERVFDFVKPKYALFGGYFVDGSLYLIPINMKAFHEGMTEYFSVSGELSTSCNKRTKYVTNFCALLTSNVHVLSLDESEHFKKAVLTDFNKLFPAENAVVFTPGVGSEQVID